MTPFLLTAAESNLLQDGQFFITKASIDAKIDALFSALKAELEDLNRKTLGFPAELGITPGRLHRGEHLGPLPWRAMDCPRSYHRHDMFAFRTLVVWGQEFSFHLLLSGKWLTEWGQKLPLSSLQEDQWLLSQQSSPWDWNLNAFTHTPIAALSATEWNAMLLRQDWIKLSLPFPLQRFEEVPAKGAALWRNLLQMFQ